MIDLEGLCNRARNFWTEGPWLIPDLTADHKANYVVPFHYLGNPEVEAFAAPEVVQGALAMNRGALALLDGHLHRMTPVAQKEGEK